GGTRKSDLSPQAGRGEERPIPTISCIFIRVLPQVLGGRRPIWYPASAALDRHTLPAAMPVTGCGGGDISPMNSSASSSRTTSAPDSFFTAGLEQADPDI